MGWCQLTGRIGHRGQPGDLGSNAFLCIGDDDWV